MTNLPTWLVVVLALAPAVLTVFGVLLTLRYNSRTEKEKARREHATWLRERRYEALADLMEAVYNYSIAAVRHAHSSSGDAANLVENAIRVVALKERASLLMTEDKGVELSKLTDDFARATDADVKKRHADTSTFDSLRVFANRQVREYDGS